MSLDLEKAQILWKLARKGNWGAKYDRLEHFKRFQNLDNVVDKFVKKDWLLIYKKQNYTGISLNTKYKKEIIEFIEKEMPHFKGVLR